MFRKVNLYTVKKGIRYQLLVPNESLNINLGATYENFKDEFFLLNIQINSMMGISFISEIINPINMDGD